MHSRKKGQSSSTKPSVQAKPTWVEHEPKVVEQLIVKIAKTGKTASQIGLILRDTYGIPDAHTILKKKITTVLQEHKLATDLPEDLRALIKRDVQIMKHMETNKQDKTAKRGLQLTESKIDRLVRYYKKTGALPKTWTYDKTKAKTFID